MTRTDILALPAAQLPRVLQAQGLLPVEVTTRRWPVGVLWMPTLDGYCVWQPHTQIAHAWPLVETWQLTIEPSLEQEEGWWVGQETWLRGHQEESGWYAATFADLPAAICRAVLLFDATRTKFEGDPDAR